jgi:hypothetical protein
MHRIRVNPKSLRPQDLKAECSNSAFWRSGLSLKLKAQIYLAATRKRIHLVTFSNLSRTFFHFSALFSTFWHATYRRNKPQTKKATQKQAPLLHHFQRLFYNSKKKKPKISTLPKDYVKSTAKIQL